MQSQAPAPHPLFFNFYKRFFKPSDKGAVQAVEYFIERWERKFKKSHKALMPEEWEHVVGTILSVWDPDLGGGADDDIGIEESQAMIDKYFKVKFGKGCDYSILHYNSPGVKSKRFYEECY